MTSQRQGAVRTVVALGRNGAIAGAAGGLAMDLIWYRRYRSEGGTSSFITWEFLSSPDGFDDASAPAKVGRAIADRANVQLPDRYAGVTGNVVHWATGIGWGLLASMLRAIPGVTWLKAGLFAGTAAWGTSYVVLPKLKIYKPITEYDTKTLWKDLSAHLVFGSVAGATSAALGRLARR